MPGALLLLSVVDSWGCSGRDVGVMSWRWGLDGTGLGRSLGEASVIQARVRREGRAESRQHREETRGTKEAEASGEAE